jgi:two-component system, sensor histidine kinase LadS
MGFDFTRIDIRKYQTEEACLEFIANQKWADGYTCRKCGHTNYCKGKSPFSRRCTRCKHEESATSHTLFHRCHIPIEEAFQIAYTVCHDPSVSSYELSRQLERRQMTCWKLKSRLMECIESRGKIDLLYTEVKITRKKQSPGQSN